MKCANPKCGKEFEPTRKGHKCCSKACASHWHYLRHKTEYAANVYYWCKRNPEKKRENDRRHYLRHREEILMKAKICYVTGKWPKGKLK